MSRLDSLDISIDPVAKKSANNPHKRTQPADPFAGLDIETGVHRKESMRPKVNTLPPQITDSLLPLHEVTTPIVSETGAIVPIIQQGTRLGSGRVVDLIGQGGMTRVYRIWNEELEMYRAVKLVNQVFSGDTSERFRTEAKICAKFDHPNIIHIYNVGRWYDIPFIEMEYIDGQTLDYYIKKFGRLPAIAAGAVAMTIARSLEHIHRAPFQIYGKEYQGIIHRDLKPSNIMIGSDGAVKLMDFGIARPVETGFHTQVNLNVVGTIQYFSPEQMDNNNVDHRTDIYALGAILYEMLSGTKTFPYTTLTSLVKMKTINSYKDLNTFDFSVQNELKSIASVCLKMEREERYRDGGELFAALEAACKNLGASDPVEIIRRYVQDPHRMEAEEQQMIQEHNQVVFEEVEENRSIGSRFVKKLSQLFGN